MEFLDGFDLTFSYSETASDDAKSLYRQIGSDYVIYEYSDWLLLQSGLSIETIANKLYAELPSIIFVTSDWYDRPATKLEKEILETNHQKKIVIDYVGDFERSTKHKIRNFEICPFDQNDLIDVHAVRAWLKESFGNQKQEI